MKRIDRETVQRIFDAADIVEVVSDFVNLKKRGTNYIGLCPFHNERTPSFSVSRARGICKCFSCGKGGSAVGFIMEHEQLSYYEALRYLAKKYNIEIKEREMTDEERRLATERESMLALNEFAATHFQQRLLKTADGRDIGLAYFRERGINDLMIERFKLGYALESFDDFYKTAIKNGFDEKYLLSTGLCSKSEQKQIVYDRFRGRVIYPIASVSGSIVAFGGRTLRTDKTMAKYVNSPESTIYHKNRELYGLYQAKRAIGAQNKCILVEGYMDVISMHQIGVENVVASSGTSLTEGQVRLIHRFTDNVTLVYDADPAGIKASLRGIDMLLAEGMNVKVLLLPPGEDPDSFAQSHSAQEVEEYFKENETDFIRFKTKILLKDANNDPIERARVINSILQSIAVIPDQIVQAQYIKECSRLLEMNEVTLALQVQKFIAEYLEKKGQPKGDAQPALEQQPQSQTMQPSVAAPVEGPQPIVGPSAKLRKYEEELIKYIVKYAMAPLKPDAENPIMVIDYVQQELDTDNIKFTDPVFAGIYEEVLRLSIEKWPEDFHKFKLSLDKKFGEAMEAGREEIRQSAADLQDIMNRETELKARCDEDYLKKIDEFSIGFIANILTSMDVDHIRKVATDLTCERYTLSKVHTRYAHVESERERLGDLVPRAVLELKLGILNQKIDLLFEEIKLHCNDEKVTSLLLKQKELYELRSSISKYLGDRIVTPPNK